MGVGITYNNAYTSAEDTLRKTYFDKLTAIRETKKRHIERYFQEIKKHVLFLTATPMLTNAATELIAGFNKIEDDLKLNDHQYIFYQNNVKTYYQNEFFTRLKSNSNKNPGDHLHKYIPRNNKSIILQHYYIAENPHPTGQKNRLVKHDDNSEYSRAHSEYHPVLNDFIRKFGIHDILIVDNKTGNIVYSAIKEVDFSTNLLTGKYRDTNPAEAFKEARNSKVTGLVKLRDFKQYEPSYFNSASFIATSVSNESGENIATLLFQISANEIDKIMTGNKNWFNEGLGRTGETYIVGDDFKMRNNSRFFIEDTENYLISLQQIGTPGKTINDILLHSTTILFQEVYTESAKEAFQGKSGTRVTKDYRGVSALSSYAALNIDGVRWAILSEIDEEEVFAPIVELRNETMLIISGVSILILILSFSFSRIITRPINSLIEGLADLGRGDFSKRIEVKSSDEIGTLTEYFNHAAEDLQNMTLLSTTDSLTNIFNRYKFEEDLRKEIDRAKRYHGDLSLIMFDIDHFKRVNDNFGHDVGDLILIEVALLVKDTIRRTDLFARWGGEEFMILTPNTDIDNAKKLAEKIRSAIQSHVFPSIKNLSCSFGVCQFKGDYDLETLTKKVDRALYQAKDNGRNRIEQAA